MLEQLEVDFPSIEANKQGRKSEAQIKTIREATGNSIWLGGGLALLVFGGCFYAFLFALESAGAFGPFALILGITGLAAFARGAHIWNLNRKLNADTIQSAEGEIVFAEHPNAKEHKDLNRFTALAKDGKRLNPMGNPGASPELPPGKYRFYFLNTRNWLLSAEPLASEDEMRRSLNEILAHGFGYDMAHLEKCRREAREGKLSTLEGIPRIEITATLKDSIKYGRQAYIHAPIFYCSIEDIKFLIPRGGSYAMINKLKHRVYYRQAESETIFGDLINLMKDKKVEAIEVA